MDRHAALEQQRNVAMPQAVKCDRLNINLRDLVHERLGNGIRVKHFAERRGENEISQRAAELSGVQDSKRTNDKIATTAAVIIFWPAAFLVSGDDAQTAELARLKGEFDAIQQVSIKKNCGTKFQARQR
jgi:hypothetical protein